LTAKQMKDCTLNEDAWNHHLVLACTKSVFNLINTSQVYKNTYPAWEALDKKWNKSNVEAIEHVNQELWDCKMMLDTEDPSLWIDVEVDQQEAYQILEHIH
jgi:hypothetical protein